MGLTEGVVLSAGAAGCRATACTPGTPCSQLHPEAEERDSGLSPSLGVPARFLMGRETMSLKGGLGSVGEPVLPLRKWGSEGLP